MKLFKQKINRTQFTVRMIPFVLLLASLVYLLLNLRENALHQFNHPNTVTMFSVEKERLYEVLLHLLEIGLLLYLGAMVVFISQRFNDIGWPIRKTVLLFLVMIAIIVILTIVENHIYISFLNKGIAVFKIFIVFLLLIGCYLPSNR